MGSDQVAMDFERVSDMRVVIAMGLVEEPQLVEVISESFGVKLRPFLPKLVKRTGLGGHRGGQLAGREMLIAGNADRLDTIDAGRIEGVDRDRMRGADCVISMNCRGSGQAEDDSITHRCGQLPEQTARFDEKSHPVPAITRRSAQRRINIVVG